MIVLSFEITFILQSADKVLIARALFISALSG